MTSNIIKCVVLLVVTVALYIGLKRNDAGEVAAALLPVAMAGLGVLVNSLLQAPKVTNDSAKTSPKEKGVEARVLVLYMFGSKGSGKTTILEHTIYRGKLPEVRPTLGFRHYDSSVPCAQGKIIQVVIKDYSGPRNSDHAIS